MSCTCVIVSLLRSGNLAHNCRVCYFKSTLPIVLWQGYRNDTEYLNTRCKRRTRASLFSRVFRTVVPAFPVFVQSSASDDWHEVCLICCLPGI